MIGTKLAHYEITSHLGSGGMGEVYQATDAKLGRSIAIKLLPEAFTHDEDRAARFEREARVLASLNHPNIAAIYGIEQSAERKFLVMELVRGETVAERIKRGPLPIDEALPIARQIADALEAAHEKNIVHRDLKPANIKVTPQGQVKVLDFGLAKAFAGEATEVNLSNSPTLSVAATQAGVILGTPSYMSPEQAKGKETDRTTDIWAFGCVLYEMLTGRTAFEGETLGEILGSVFKADPDWKRLPVETPASIRRLLGRCLHKDRNLRLRDAADARLEILEPRGEVEPAAGQSKGSERLAWIAALVAVAVTATWIALHFRASVVDAQETRVDIITPSTADLTSFAISPDGRRLVFAGSDARAQLWLRPLDSPAAQPLAGTEGASFTFPFWSPDSKSIGFFANGKLKRIDIDGGLAQVLADAPGGRGGAWSPDGVIVFASSGTLFRVPASGGEAAAVTKLDIQPQTNHQLPQFLPGGHQFLFYGLGSADGRGIYLGSLDSPETKRLTAADAAGLYLASGWLLYIRQGTLVARRFDPSRGELTGDPVTVADSVAFNTSVTATAQGAFSVSATGLIAYRSGGSGEQRQLTWFDRTGKVLGSVGAPDENNLRSPRLSPDGRRVAVERTVQGNADVWVMDETRVTRFTFDPQVDMYPLWTRDGRQIAFQSTRKGSNYLYGKPSDGAGNEEVLFEFPSNGVPSDNSPDGRFLLFASGDLHVLPLDGNRKPQLFVHTEFPKQGARFSPDGRWVSYHSNESGRWEIYVRPFPGPGGVWQLSAGGGVSSRWRPDGKELYYIAPDGKLMAVPIATQRNTLVPGSPAALFQTRIALGPLNTNRAQYDIAPDGRILMNVTLDDNSSSLITLLQNWKPPVK